MDATLVDDEDFSSASGQRPEDEKSEESQDFDEEAHNTKYQIQADEFDMDDTEGSSDYTEIPDQVTGQTSEGTSIEKLKEKKPTNSSSTQTIEMANTFTNQTEILNETKSEVHSEHEEQGTHHRVGDENKSNQTEKENVTVVAEKTMLNSKIVNATKTVESDTQNIAQSVEERETPETNETGVKGNDTLEQGAPAMSRNGSLEFKEQRLPEIMENPDVGHKQNVSMESPDVDQQSVIKAQASQDTKTPEPPTARQSGERQSDNYATQEDEYEVVENSGDILGYFRGKVFFKAWFS